MNQLNGDETKLITNRNKIEITKLKKMVNKKVNNKNENKLSQSLNKNMNNLTNLSNKNLSNSLDHNLNKKLNTGLNHNVTMVIDKNKLCTEYSSSKYFNGNLNNNDNDLDNLNISNNKQIKQIKSTSFESNLTDDYNSSEHSTDFINGDSSSNNLEDDEQADEMDELLDKRINKDQKIVEVVSFCFFFQTSLLF